jgi:hypothetical protein
VNAPLFIQELSTGLEARYADGHVATLTFAGKSCTCDVKHTGYLCPHLTAALPAYVARKWRIIDANDNYHGPRFLRSVGIDPMIFNPPTVDWNREDPDAYLVWRRLWSSQKGWLFQFFDGAFFCLLDDHPDAGTKCSLCHTRDCKHVKDALEQLKAHREEVA